MTLRIQIAHKFKLVRLGLVLRDRSICLQRPHPGLGKGLAQVK